MKDTNWYKNYTAPLRKLSTQDTLRTVWKAINIKNIIIH